MSINYGPVPPETNPPITPFYYEPSVFIVANITNGSTTTVTTTEPHNYVLGQLVRLLVPMPWKMFQISGQPGYVISIPSSTEVTININSTTFNAFNSSPANPTPTLPQIIAIGDINTGSMNTIPSNSGTFIPGSFINISPLQAG